mmetsp:Transcript_36260/g.86441  ORF Transcript_36260/g.86441 Transcript_36260/m.86441 type:complete len:289 (+) Transcript_36260:994-1860(+)
MALGVVGVAVAAPAQEWTRRHVAASVPSRRIIIAAHVRRRRPENRLLVLLESHVALALHALEGIAHRVHERLQRPQSRGPVEAHLGRLRVAAPVQVLRVPRVLPPELDNLRPNKWVRREECAVAPLTRVLLTAAPNEVEHIGTPLIGIGEGRRRLARDEEDGPKRVQVAVRRRPLGHLDGRDAEAPNVGASVVVRLLDNLRRDPEGTPHDGLPLVDRVRQLGRNAEVGELDVPVVRQEDVPALDVAVAYLLLVKVLESQDAAGARRAYRLLGHGEATPSAGRLDEVAD